MLFANINNTEGRIEFTRQESRLGHAVYVTVNLSAGFCAVWLSI